MELYVLNSEYRDVNCVELPTKDDDGEITFAINGDGVVVTSVSIALAFGLSFTVLGIIEKFNSSDKRRSSFGLKR